MLWQWCRLHLPGRLCELGRPATSSVVTQHTASVVLLPIVACVYSQADPAAAAAAAAAAVNLFKFQQDKEGATDDQWCKFDDALVQVCMCLKGIGGERGEGEGGSP